MIVVFWGVILGGDEKVEKGSWMNCGGKKK